MSLFKKKRMHHEIKFNNDGVPYLVPKHYSVEEKIDYYSKRINDDKLRETQRRYARIKVGMLTSGVGRVYIINDQKLGNPNSKIRRVVPTAINELNKNVLINPIYSHDSRFRKKIRRFYSEKEDGDYKIPIFYKESFLDVEARKKSEDEYFNLDDLQETTSTVDPFQLDELLNYVYPENEVSYLDTHNKYLKRRL